MRLMKSSALLLLLFAFIQSPSAIAGQCSSNGLNYHPITKARQAGFDYLCQGHRATLDDFHRFFLDGGETGWPHIEGGDQTFAELYRLRAERNRLQQEIANKEAERRRQLALSQQRYQESRKDRR